MFDTIHLRLEWDEAGVTPSSVPLLLDDCTLHTRNSVNTVSGYKDNIRVFMNDTGIYLKGSLSKYYLGDNINSITRSGIERACEKLSDELNLPIHKARPTRIDIAQNFIMNLPPEHYFPYLGECHYFNRLIQPNSLYYRNKSHQLVFYNKLKEITSRGLKIPAVWLNQNVLRYEYRMEKNVSKMLKVPGLKFRDIFDESLYMKLVNRYFDQYKAISKMKNITLDYSIMKKPNDFHNYMLARYYQQLGSSVYDAIEELRANEVFEHKEYYSRLKSEIRKKTTSIEKCNQSELILELDEKIDGVKSYYR